MAYRWLLKPKWLVIIPLLAILAVAVACGEDATNTPVPPAVPNQATATPEPSPTPTTAAMMGPEGTLNVGWKELGPFRFSPMVALQSLASVGLSVGESLLTLDEKGEVHPKIAKEWKVSSDGLTYTLRSTRGSNSMAATGR